MTRPRKAPRVLVVYKKSAYQVYVTERKNEQVTKLIREENPIVSRLVEAHHDHSEAMDLAKEALRKIGARAVFRYRSDAHAAGFYDLVVTLGGDGTLLWASHLIGAEVPIVAINTAPKNSVGFFAAGTKENLADTLSDALAGKLKTTSLTRMSAYRDGELVTSRILNEALFSHECPAATSRYVMRLRDHEEEHKSSGIWVGTAAGSTAAMKSAGGRVLPMTSERIQFVVREPYEVKNKKYALKKGLFGASDILTVTSKMRAGRLYVDGSHLAHHVQMGVRLEFRKSHEPLQLLGFTRRK